jgi:transforming growth factor-beta-induced protein
MRIRRTRATRATALAGLAALTLAVAACGGDDDTAAPANAPPAGSMAPAGTEPMTTDAAGAALEPSGPACSSIPDDGEGSFAGMADDPAATAASNNPELSTVVAAVQAAGLVDTLNGEGPFTIFAPANSAFAKIPADQLDALLADPTGDLTSILTLHVVAGERLSSADLAEVGSVATVNGEEITFSADGDAISVNGDQATVVCADVPTANATVHIIDGVLMPGAMNAADQGAALEPSGPACSSIPMRGEGSFTGMADDPAATAASNNPELSTLVSAVQAAGLVDTLNGKGPFTIFAPANSAFAKLPRADLEAVLADPAGLLTTILTYHVVAGEQLSSADLAEVGSVTTVEGEELTFSPEGGALTINGGQGTVVCADVPTANATVHIIDGVLMPSA